MSLGQRTITQLSTSSADVAGMPMSSCAVSTVSRLGRGCGRRECSKRPDQARRSRGADVTTDIQTWCIDCPARSFLRDVRDLSGLATVLRDSGFQLITQILVSHFTHA